MKINYHTKLLRLNYQNDAGCKSTINKGAKSYTFNKYKFNEDGFPLEYVYMSIYAYIHLNLMKIKREV